MFRFKASDACKASRTQSQTAPRNSKAVSGTLASDKSKSCTSSGRQSLRRSELFSSSFLVRNGGMDCWDYYKGTFRDYHRDPFHHSLLSTKQSPPACFHHGEVAAGLPQLKESPRQIGQFRPTGCGLTARRTPIIQSCFNPKP